MANPDEKPDLAQKPGSINPSYENDDDEEDLEEEEDDDLDEESEPAPPREKMAKLLSRMKSDAVPLRVHDVIVKGNTKTKEYLIEEELEAIKNATSMQEIIQAASVVNYKLQELECFDSVNITLDAGPPELPGTANVIIEVVETKSPLSGQIGTFTKGEAKSSSVEGSLKYKNFLGYGDLWDASLAYGFDRSAEVSAGVYLPRFKGLVSPLTVRVSLLSQDWLKFSSYKEQSFGLSLGLFSSKHHELGYNLAWRTLTDPSQMSSRSIRRQLGHDFLSSLKYTFRFDKRNSHLRPTRGYAFVSTTQIGGLAPDNRTLRFLRQELDLRFAVPFGFYRTALNFGVSSGVLCPLGRGFLSMSSSVPERFFLGGNISPVCHLGGPSALWGFKTRGLGPAEPRRQMSGSSSDENADPSERDFLGGDLAVSAFADLSFDLPLRWFREKGIHGHLFACAGSVAKLTENEYRNFSFAKVFGVFSKFFRRWHCFPNKSIPPRGELSVNYCYILKKFDHDHGKSGIQISLSAAS
ncbi:hypothetical protein Patl1_06655 [Pistacia atlantica]|uniref:Uncharacterized protein n=1 Tax=Pistacia atlantica TaxID=434234 RepID=A0ACC1BV58_9ROSI|nr:hypothetical protein Patl1_06655 [Pistacia atlantica]